MKYSMVYGRYIKLPEFGCTERREGRKEGVMEDENLCNGRSAFISH